MTALPFNIAAASIIAIAPFVRREDKYPAFCVAIGSLVFSVLLAIPLYLTAVFHPQTMDAALYHADRALGLDPLAICQFVMQLPWLKASAFLITSSGSSDISK
jgi:hypothetical protein